MYRKKESIFLYCATERCFRGKRETGESKRTCELVAEFSPTFVSSMRSTLQRPAPPSAWHAERKALRSTPSLALQRAQFASKAARAPRPFGEMRRSSSSTRETTPSDKNPTSTSSAQTRVLMVCLGNICRSPAAEAVLDHLVRKRKLEGSVFVDSCGTVCISYFLLSGLKRCSLPCDGRRNRNRERSSLSRDHSPSPKQK